MLSDLALCEIESGRTPVTAETAAKYARLGGLSEIVAIESCFQDQLRKAKIDYSVHLERKAR